nr:type II toxin-antitoxin system YoeB family toxin [Streptomyces griseus]
MNVPRAGSVLHTGGAWSRRMDEEHRLVHLVGDKEIAVLAARYR